MYPFDNMYLLQRFPLHVACREGHAELIPLLIQYNASVKARDREGYNCLNVAVMHGQKLVFFVRIMFFIQFLLSSYWICAMQKLEIMAK